MSGHPDSNRGIALLAVLLLSVLIATVALGLSLILALQHLAVLNARESAVLAHAATAGIELGAQALDDADWSSVLAGTANAPGSDGDPVGVRTLEGGATIDLAELTNLQNCGTPGVCDDASLRAVTAERPWGANNPTWRLFLYGPLATLATFQRAAPVYVLVWVGDDGRERDGDPARDGGATGEGAGVLVLRAVAFGRGGGRRGFDAEVSRICRAGHGVTGCQPGIRVQSWRDLRWSVP